MMNRKPHSKTYTENLAKIKDICAGQEKSPSEVLGLLKRWGLDHEKSQEIIGILKAENFIDERRYASAFVRDKIKFDRWGVAKIKYALLKKGIPANMTAEAIQSFDKEAYHEMIKNELVKKARMLKGPLSANWQKLARFGSSRGYEMEIMYDILDEICKEK